jgi:hypothetical protein
LSEELNQIYSGYKDQPYEKVDHDLIFEQIDKLVATIEGNPPLDVSFAYNNH